MLNGREGAEGQAVCRPTAAMPQMAGWLAVAICHKPLLPLLPHSLKFTRLLLLHCPINLFCRPRHRLSAHILCQPHPLTFPCSMPHFYTSPPTLLSLRFNFHMLACLKDYERAMQLYTWVLQAKKSFKFFHNFLCWLLAGTSAWRRPAAADDWPVYGQQRTIYELLISECSRQSTPSMIFSHSKNPFSPVVI